MTFFFPIIYFKKRMSSDLEELFKSKEFKALQKCTIKNCPKFKKNIEKETKIVDEIEKLAKAIQSEKDNKTKTRLTMKMLAHAQALFKAMNDKKAMMCKVEGCAREFVELQQVTNNAAIKRVDNMSKLLKKWAL